MVEDSSRHASRAIEQTLQSGADRWSGPLESEASIQAGCTPLREPLTIARLELDNKSDKRARPDAARALRRSARRSRRAVDRHPRTRPLLPPDRITARTVGRCTGARLARHGAARGSRPRKTLVWGAHAIAAGMRASARGGCAMTAGILGTIAWLALLAVAARAFSRYQEQDTTRLDALRRLLENRPC